MTAETNNQPKPKVKEPQKPPPTMETATPEFGSYAVERATAGAGASPGSPNQPHLSTAASVFAAVLMRQTAAGAPAEMPAHKTARPLRQAALVQFQRQQGNAAAQRHLAYRRDAVPLIQRTPDDDPPVGSVASPPAISPAPTNGSAPAAMPGEYASTPEQVSSPQNTSNGANSGAATSAQIATPVGSEEAAVAFAQFVERVNARKQTLTVTAEMCKQEILARAEAQKTPAQQRLQAERLRLGEAYAQTMSQIQGTAVSARTEITTRRDQALETIRSGAVTEMENLHQRLAERQNEVRAAAAAKATAARDAGEEEAQRALTESASRAAAAQALAANAPTDVQGEASQMAREAVARISSAGDDMASAARQDGQQLAGKFQTEGTEAANGFVELSDRGRQNIVQIKDEAIAGIHALHQDEISQINTAEHQARQEVMQGYQQAQQQLQQLGPATEAALDEAAQTAVMQVDENVQRALAFVDERVSALAAEIGIFPDELIGENIAAANAEIENTLSQCEQNLQQLVTELDASLLTVTDTAVQEAANQVDQVAEPLQRVGDDFAAYASEKVITVTGQIDQAETESLTAMQQVVTDVDSELAAKVRECEEAWVEKLQEGIREISQKVSAGLAEQANILAEVTGQINELIAESQRQQNQGILEQIWEGIAGFFSGLWDNLVNLVTAIVEHIGVILAVVLVVLAIALIIAAVLVFAGVFATLGAALAAVFAVIGKILLVLGIIMAVVAIVVLVVTAVRVFSDDSLSIREKWRAIGHAFGDVLLSLVEIFVALKYLGLLGRLLRIAGGPAELLSLIRRAGGVVKLMQLLERVDNVADLIRLLDKVGDAAKLIQLLDKVGDAGQLLQLLDKVSDVSQLVQLLDKAGDAAQLLRLLDKVSDTGQLVQLLDKVSDSAQLLRLLDKASDSNQLLRLLNSPKITDAAQLERLLDQKTLPAALERLLALDKITDAAQLERLLALVDDPLRLGGLLNKVDNAAQLERLLGAAQVGGAARLEDMLRYHAASDLENFLSSGNPIWVGEFGAAPAHARHTATHVIANGGTPPPGYVGGRLYGNGRNPADMILPTQDSAGNPITYREYDVHPRVPGVNRGAERIVIGSDGRVYYTNTHYSSFTQFTP